MKAWFIMGRALLAVGLIYMEDALEGLGTGK